jgi:putative transcriptional regulator
MFEGVCIKLLTSTIDYDWGHWQSVSVPSCLTMVEPLSAKEIAAIRKRAGVSQGVFAHYLNVKPKLVSEWERGEKRPSGPSLKLLSIVKTKGLDAIT